MIKGERSRVPKGSNRTREYKNGKIKSERSDRLANTKVCQGYTEILGIGKLLLPIHQRFCVHSQTFA